MAHSASSHCIVYCTVFGLVFLFCHTGNAFLCSVYFKMAAGAPVPLLPEDLLGNSFRPSQAGSMGTAELHSTFNVDTFNTPMTKQHVTPNNLLAALLPGTIVKPGSRAASATSLATYPLDSNQTFGELAQPCCISMSGTLVRPVSWLIQAHHQVAFASAHLLQWVLCLAYALQKLMQYSPTALLLTVVCGTTIGGTNDVPEGQLYDYHQYTTLPPGMTWCCILGLTASCTIFHRCFFPILLFLLWCAKLSLAWLPKHSGPPILVTVTCHKSVAIVDSSTAPAVGVARQQHVCCYCTNCKCVRMQLK